MKKSNIQYIDLREAPLGNNVQNEDRIRFVVADKVTRIFPLVATNGASLPYVAR
jgi:hypothetical protein